MKQLQFAYDEEANGYLSESFQLEKRAMIRVYLQSQAPVVTLKLEDSGEWSNYGQTPKNCDCYEINLTSNEEVTLMLATPVPVMNCYIL